MKNTKKKLGKKKVKRVEELKNLNLNAAGIDVGSRSHFVAIPEGRSKDHVREFQTFQPDLVDLCDWLKENEIDTVAMESTGVYWIPVYELLEENGFKVLLVNSYHMKNVPGRKTDVLDCQWIQQLHSYGLLRGSFRPDADICRLRSVRRTRDNLIRHASSHIQHLQKSLTEMNVLLHNVISSVVGVSGLRIIKAIIDGDRDPVALANLCNKHCKSSNEDIIKSLSGNYRSEHVFSLKMAYEMYFSYQEKIAECDKEIECILNSFESKVDQEASPLAKLSSNRKPRNRVGQNNYNFDVRGYLYEKSGVDITAIYGISESTALTVLSEIGFCVTPWSSAKRFASWLGLCPGSKVSGGKILSSKTKPCANKVATALRIAAMTIGRTQTALGSYYRRIKSRCGAPKAITAVAHKLARTIFSMLSTKSEYKPLDQDYYEKKYQNRLLHSLKKRAESLGYVLVEA